MAAKLAVLHHRRSFFPLDLRTAVGDAAELLWVVVDDTSDDLSIRRLLRRLGTVVEIAGLNVDEAAGVLAEHQPQGIVTFVDDNLVLAADLAARLDLPYHSPELARTLADKQRQRATLAAAGVPSPRFWPLSATLSRESLAELACDVRYPAVLKPAAGSGSRGIVDVGGPDDLLSLRRPGVEELVEEYMFDDPQRDRRFASYLSVESVVSHGTASHVAITGRFPLAEPFRETGNFIPAAIAPVMRGPLLEITDAAITALGITTGVLHTEIKLTPDGPRLIELNGRLGGRPPFVLQSVSDVNLFRVACQLALDEHVTFPGLVPCCGVGYWRMLQPPRAARAVKGVRGLDALSALPQVDSARLNRRPDDAVDWQEGTDGQVVTVRGRVDDLGALAETIAFIDRIVDIDFDLNGVRTESVGSTAS